jgi:hypothetical protein
VMDALVTGPALSKPVAHAIADAIPEKGDR